MSSIVYIPWYATVLRHDALAEAVAEVAPIALRYGATRYAVHRSRDDRYKITQMSWFESEADWYRYWEGPEMIEFRADNSGRFQVPIVYVWHDELTAGEIVIADEVESTASTA
ncbi:MAG TPA: hypothetical protein VG295_09985 [Solirubrobacteraceae bacterium]|jgi:hypothetical protein|nr:hypothetical protein [Solirubrobacteraceae bacterium]